MDSSSNSRQSHQKHGNSYEGLKMWAVNRSFFAYELCLSSKNRSQKEFTVQSYIRDELITAFLLEPTKILFLRDLSETSCFCTAIIFEIPEQTFHLLEDLWNPHLDTTKKTLIGITLGRRIFVYQYDTGKISTFPIEISWDYRPFLLDKTSPSFVFISSETQKILLHDVSTGKRQEIQGISDFSCVIVELQCHFMLDFLVVTRHKLKIVRKMKRSLAGNILLPNDLKKRGIIFTYDSSRGTLVFVRISRGSILKIIRNSTNLSGLSRQLPWMIQLDFSRNLILSTHLLFSKIDVGMSLTTKSTLLLLQTGHGSLEIAQLNEHPNHL
eukprot:TRINITY_DN7344_c0_g1_i13.p1 TRINITY_DN7344_c0_g1~~TRINITY_DN7344_c0_g1_i13.p1  ORF type:complete len:326 (+),score=27.06 TRINITY_DN7344_c0_g1_i13:150-1127(+)